MTFKIYIFYLWPKSVEQFNVSSAIYWFILELNAESLLFNPFYKCGQYKVIEHSLQEYLYLVACSACFAWEVVNADWLWHLVTFMPLVDRSPRCAAADAHVA